MYRTNQLTKGFEVNYIYPIELLVYVIRWLGLLLNCLLVFNLIDCSALVCFAKHIPISTSHESRTGRQDSGPAQWSKNNARWIKLDIHGHNWHDRLEFFTQRCISETFPTGLARGQLIPQFFAGRTNSEILWLFTGFLAQTASHFPSKKNYLDHPKELPLSPIEISKLC